MQTYNLSDIRELCPCYDPVKYLRESWTGDITDILRVADCPLRDRLWVVSRLALHPNDRLLNSIEAIKSWTELLHKVWLAAEDENPSVRDTYTQDLISFIHKVEEKIDG